MQKQRKGHRRDRHHDQKPDDKDGDAAAHEVAADAQLRRTPTAREHPRGDCGVRRAEEHRAGDRGPCGSVVGQDTEDHPAAGEGEPVPGGHVDFCEDLLPAPVDRIEGKMRFRRADRTSHNVVTFAFQIGKYRTFLAGKSRGTTIERPLSRPAGSSVPCAATTRPAFPHEGVVGVAQERRGIR